MSKYLLIRATERSLSNGDISRSFETTADFLLDGEDFFNYTVKIDTGCGLSTIPYFKLRKNETLCKIKKEEDLKNNVPYTFSYGVESGGRVNKLPVTPQEMMQSEAIKFRHLLRYMNLGGYELGDRDVYINYNRRGNILIGMDILVDFEIFIARSQIDGKYMMIACLKNQTDKQEFYDAVRLRFGFVPRL